jgi:hypothetical protein
MKRALDNTGLTWFPEVRERSLPHLEPAERQYEFLAIGCSCPVMDDQ